MNIPAGVKVHAILCQMFNKLFYLPISQDMYELACKNLNTLDNSYLKTFIEDKVKWFHFMKGFNDLFYEYTLYNILNSMD